MVVDSGLERWWEGVDAGGVGGRRWWWDVPTLRVAAVRMAAAALLALMADV